MVTLGQLQVFVFHKSIKYAVIRTAVCGARPHHVHLAPVSLPPRETQTFNFLSFRSFQGREISHIREKKEVLTQQQTC